MTTALHRRRLSRTLVRPRRKWPDGAASAHVEPLGICVGSALPRPSRALGIDVMRLARPEVGQLRRSLAWLGRSSPILLSAAVRPWWRGAHTRRTRAAHQMPSHGGTAATSEARRRAFPECWAAERPIVDGREEGVREDDRHHSEDDQRQPGLVMSPVFPNPAHCQQAYRGEEQQSREAPEGPNHAGTTQPTKRSSIRVSLSGSGGLSIRSQTGKHDEDGGRGNGTATQPSRSGLLWQQRFLAGLRSSSVTRRR
jgi:hypothetical protein